MEQYIWLTILTLAQGVLIAFKIIEKKTNKNPGAGSPDPPCADHGARLASLETAIEAMEKRLDRMESKINGLR